VVSRTTRHVKVGRQVAGARNLLQLSSQNRSGSVLCRTCGGGEFAAMRNATPAFENQPQEKVQTTGSVNGVYGIRLCQQRGSPAGYARCSNRWNGCGKVAGIGGARAKGNAGVTSDKWQQVR